MMHQTYSDYHLFVAVKGVSEFIFQKILLPAFQEFIDAGKLTLRHFPNKNQIANFIDTIRDLDISDFEIFAKIDDDDFYGREYLTIVNDFHCLIPQHHGSCYIGTNPVKYSNSDGYMSLQFEGFQVFGASMVFTAENMKEIIKYEANPALITDYTRRCDNGNAHCNFGFSEDNLYHMIMKDSGFSNIEPYISARHIFPYIIVQKSNRSVTRGGLVTSEFHQHNDAISSDPTYHEHVIELMHPYWADSFIILGSIGKRVAGNDEAYIIAFTPEEVTLKWKNWGTETFRKKETGAYELESPLHTGHK